MKHAIFSCALAVAAASTGFSQTAMMPPETGTFTGPTRGYWFTAPTDFTITGVRALDSPGGTNTMQNFAVVRFDAMTPPPAFPTVTNAITNIEFGFDLPSATFAPVNISVAAGDVMGIYGNTTSVTGGTSGLNSYAGVTQPTTMIGGMSVDLFRSGMQTHLGSATSPMGMMDIFAEPAGFNISRVEFTYTLGAGVGTSFCGPAVANSTGSGGEMSASGSSLAQTNDLTLIASQLPPNQFGIFVTSRTQAISPGAGGTSNGDLCLGGVLGRFTGPGQILSSGAMGEFELTIDLTAVPEGGSFQSVMAGETWNFQAWYRDGVGLGSNFTDGLEVSFN